MKQREAKEAGLVRFNGKPCKRGHGTLRYTASAGCVECQRLDAISRSKGIPYQKSKAAIKAERVAAIAAMLKESQQTYMDISRAMKIARSTVWRLLAAMHDAKAIHIRSWHRTSGAASPIYAHGPGRDAPKPQPLTMVQHAAKARARRQADPVKQTDYEMKRRAENRRARGSFIRRDDLVAALFGDAK